MQMHLLTELEDFLVQGPNLTFRNVLSVIDKGAFRLALVVDSDGLLVGILSDGDVRRALLSGKALDDNAFTFVNRNPKCIPQASISLAESLAVSAGIDQVVVGAIGHKPMGLYVRGTSSTDIELPPVLLMAGGQGTRLRPMTLTTPKPLIEVGGRPILERILESLAYAGIPKVFLSVNYLKTQVMDLARELNHLGIDIVSLEEDEPMGTAGPISLIPDLTSFEKLIVMNADLLVDLDFRAFVRSHDQNSSAATIAVREHVTQLQFGVVGLSKGVVSGIQEKPVVTSLVAAGIYLLGSHALAQIKQGPKDMPDLLNDCISSGLRVDAFPIHQNWIDIGTPDDLEKARNLLQEAP